MKKNRADPAPVTVGLVGELDTVFPTFQSPALEQLYRKHFFSTVVLKSTRLTCSILLCFLLCVQVILDIVNHFKPPMTRDAHFIVAIVLIVITITATFQNSLQLLLQIFSTFEKFSPQAAVYYWTVAAYTLIGVCFTWNLKKSCIVGSEEALSDFPHESVLVFALTFTTLISQLACLMFLHTLLVVAAVNATSMYVILSHFTDHSLVILLLMGCVCNLGMWWQREHSLRDTWRMTANVADWSLFHQLSSRLDDSV